MKSGENRKSLISIGGLPALTRSLQTSAELGLNDDERLKEERVRLYGDNQPLIKPPVSFWALVWEGLNDNIIRVLIAAAIVSLIVGSIQEPGDGWMEGTAILLAVVLVVSITATNDYSKDKQFRKLNDLAQARQVVVTRRGETVDVSIYSLLVGDLMQIKTGDVLPADGVLVRAVNMVVDESSITGESDRIKKGAFTDLEDEPTPFLLSGSKIEEGTGTMIVLAVGKKSFAGRNADLVAGADDGETDLQKRLEGLTNSIGNFGTLVAILTFFVLTVYNVNNSVNKGEWGDQSWDQLINAFIIGVTIIVVAVPEGLPLAVTLSLAYSVDKMKDQNNLVRHLHACEEMGAATDICSDKTGTLTENVMTVVEMYIEEGVQTFSRQSPPSLSDQFKELLVLGAIHNSTANITVEENREKLSGNRTECALLALAKDLGYDYGQIRRNDYELQLPFSSGRKSMTTAVHLEGNTYRIFCKGTPAVVLNNCSYVANAGLKIDVLSPELKGDLLNRVVDGFGAKNLRALALAYKDIDVTELPLFIDEHKKEPNEALVQSDLILIAIVGIQDPIRKGVPEAVEIIKGAGILVRMVTGDNIKTAVNIAKTIGIIPKNYAKIGDADYTVMEGLQFRTITGGLKQDENGVYIVSNANAFARIASKLRVLAAADPADKFLLVTGLKALDRIVAVTGDGTNDAPALKQANVGFAMNLVGTQLAKEASDIVLLDDNFASIVTSVMWGRNIYDSIRKFLQFQLTVNLVALAMSFLGAVVLEEPPLTSVQMLWVNLIMDTFAALALATEPPSLEILKRKPYSKSKNLVTTSMMRNIVGQSIYQISWLCFILFSADQVLGIPSGWGNAVWTEESGVHFTIFFNTFVFLQIFNEIFCRKLKAHEFDVFSGFFNNPLFLGILLVTIVVQVAIVQFGGQWLKCSPLTLSQHALCVAIGAGGVLFGVLLKLIPTSFFMCCRFVDRPAPKVAKTSLASTFRSRTKSRSSAQIRNFHRGFTVA